MVRLWFLNTELSEENDKRMFLNFGTTSPWMVSLNCHLEVTLWITYCVFAVIGLLVGLVDTALVGKHPHNHPVICPLKHHSKIIIQGISSPEIIKKNYYKKFKILQLSCIRFQTSCNWPPNEHTQKGRFSLYKHVNKFPGQLRARYR